MLVVAATVGICRSDVVGRLGNRNRRRDRQSIGPRRIVTIGMVFDEHARCAEIGDKPLVDHPVGNIGLGEGDIIELHIDDGREVGIYRGRRSHLTG